MVDAYSTTHRHDFNSAEVIPGDEYQPRHRDISLNGLMNAHRLDVLAKIPETPTAQYVGKHRHTEASLLAKVRRLHQPREVPAIPGYPSLTAFTVCTCTPGMLFTECPTACALGLVPVSA